MDTILTFANTVSPLGIIALLVVVIFYLVGGKKLFGNKEDSIENKSDNDIIDLAMLNRKLDTIASNHLHELPEMKQILDRIEAKQIQQGERIAGVEAKLEILLK